MDGFEKFELGSKREHPIPSQSQKSSFVSMSRKRKYGFPKSTPRILIGIVVILVLFGVGFVLPAYKTYKSGTVTYRQAKVFAAQLKTQNIAQASVELEKTKKDLADTQKNLGYLFYLHFVPLANFYYNDIDHMLKAGAAGLNASTDVIESLKPYADVLGLKGEGSFTTGSAEDRIKTAVMTMGKITPRIDAISNALVTAKKEVDAVDPNHYPTLLFGSKVKTQLTKMQELTDQGVSFVDQARPLIKVIPSLLGESEEKKYLVIFQNDKELRATGGFITAYAIFRIDKGHIQVDKSDDIYTLDASIPDKPKAPAAILKYLPKVYEFNLRDSNISPDFIESMKIFQSLYDKASLKVPVDGIIAIDTNVLVSTIKILDDQVTAQGITFTTQNDSRCNCPQVIYELEDNISRPVNYIKTERKSLLGSLLNEIMAKALSSSPKVYWGPLFQSMLMNINQKHILFDLNDQEAQNGIVALNAAGKIKDFDGDYLHINDVNFSGAKSNLFIQQQVENAYDVKSDGTIEKTVTINYKNPQPPSDCNLERGGLCLNAEHRDWLRIYVPKGSQLIDSKGSQVKVTNYDELGKTVFEGFITVRPEGAATFTITYRLPFKLQNGSPLPLLIQKQPGTNGNDYTVTKNGKTLSTFQLFADKELKLKL